MVMKDVLGLKKQMGESADEKKSSEVLRFVITSVKGEVRRSLNT
jgi:hypothetical protein